LAVVDRCCNCGREQAVRCEPQIVSLNGDQTRKLMRPVRRARVAEVLKAHRAKRGC
jgi:hypothetical protein